MTLAPMITMAITSMTTVFTTIMNINNGSFKVDQSLLYQSLNTFLIKDSFFTILKDPLNSLYAIADLSGYI